MNITGTKSWQLYSALCKMLQKNDIMYESDNDNMLVRCTVNGKDTEINLQFTIDASKMLITLISVVPVEVKRDRASDVAMALCLVNNRLYDGAFSLDMANMLVYYKMTSSFYNSHVNTSVYEYMLSEGANVMDEYYMKLKNIINGDEPYSLPEEENDSEAEFVEYLLNKNKQQ